MNNNQELTALANEFKATMNHAEKIFNEYMEAAIDQAIEDAINESVDDMRNKKEELEKKIEDTIFGLENVTVIMITHSLNKDTLNKAEQILY